MSQNICNICGANYEYRNGRWKCPACGAFKAEELSNEEVTLFYNAAQKLRLCDFDEAEKAYTDIVEKFPQNPNGYWERLLSRYGIKYEEDFDGRKIPTCYAASIESVLNDKDYIKALSLADADTKAYFEQQAQYIERVRKEWIERARKEKPYDIFICYKDSDLANGVDRTKDSIAAQDLYIHLTEQGYRVFFSRESLRDKVGEKYEPYIFNALSTAKVMLVYGSSAEYITSTWLKNEWTRYEKRLQTGEKKSNSLIVACDGFSPSELPKALSSMQCMDATKRSFYTDLDVVLKRIIKGEDKPKPTEPIKTNKKKSKKLPIAIASISVVIAVLLCILLPNLFGNEPTTSIIDSKYGVVITAQDEIFDKNTSVIVDRLSDGTQYEALVSAVNNANSIVLQNAVVYDIDCDVDIAQNVTVRVAYAKSKADSSVKVYYVSDDKTVIEEHSNIFDNGSVEFKTNHLSYYVIGEIEGAASTPGGDDTPIIPSLTYEDGVLQVGVCADYEPYEYIENGQLKGVEIDILKAIATELGLEIRFENDEFEDLLYNLNAKDVDCIIGVTETAQRNQLATASKVMFSADDIEHIIYVDKDCNNLLQAINNAIDELNSQGSILSIVEQYTTAANENETNYNSALNLIDAGDYEGAYKTLYSLGDYKDTIELLNNFKILPKDIRHTEGAEELYLVKYQYDLSGNVIKETWIYDNWREFFTYTYDSNGLKTQEKYENWDDDSWIYNYTYDLDSQGRVVKEYWTDESGEVTTVTYTYNSNGKILKRVVTWADGNVSNSEYTYNSQGLLQKETYTSSSFNVTNTIEYTYDESNRITSETETDSNGNVYTNQYVYDDYGIIQKINRTTADSTIVMSYEGYYWFYFENSVTDSVVNSVEITFNANGGTGSMESISADTNDSVTLPKNTFTKDGYAFAGWSKTQNSSAEYEDQSEFTVGAESKYTLYAIWSANNNSLILKANDGTSNEKTVNLKTDESKNLPANSFTRAGYTFMGWSSYSNGNVEFENEATYTMGTSSQTLYAVWSANENEIVFNANGGKGTMSAQKIETNQSATLSSCSYTKDGYVFAGWAITLGGAVVYQDQASYTMGTESQYTLYAVWSTADYTITYVLNGGTNNLSNPSGYDVTDATITLQDPTRAGYTFNGWFATSSFTTESNTIPTGSTGNKTFYASWTANKNTIKFNSNGGSGTMSNVVADTDSTITLTQNTFSRNGYTFAGWSTVSNGSVQYADKASYKVGADSSYTLYAVWNIVNYSISYDVDGGTVSGQKTFYNVETTTFTLPTPEKTGYTFLGWSGTGITGTQKNVSVTKGSTGNREYTANWQANTNTIMLNADGGTVSISSVSATYDDELDLPTPSKTGYTFAGWFYNSTEYADGSTWKGTKNITLTARWNARTDTKYVVNYYLECTDSSGYELKESQTLEGMTGASVTPTVKTYAYFNSPTAKTVSIKADGTLVVDYYYTRYTYTVSFITNGGESIDSQTYKYEQVVDLPNAVRAGYTFGGWYHDAKQKESALNWKVWCDTTMYAWWQEETKAGDFVYAGSESIIIKGYSGGETDIVIPCYIGGVPVVEIGSKAFMNNSSNYGNTSVLSTVILPETVVTIGEDAFWQCTGLTTCNLSNNITTIEKYAFYGCTNLITATIGNGVTSIPTGLFNNCTNLESIYLGENIETIYSDAFFWCNSLTEIHIPTLNEWMLIDWLPADSVPFMQGYDLYINGILLKELVIPDQLTEVKNFAFARCKSIESVVLHNELQSIGIGAFYACTGVDEIIIPESVTTIGIDAFNGCAITIKCESPSKPDGWNDGWNTGNQGTVTWFYIGDVWDGTTSYSFAGGTGTEQDPYLISNAEQLAYVATSVNQGVDTFSGKYLKLTSNLHLNDIEWTPIGATNSFGGVFDGNDYSIHGLKISSISTNYGGLFGYVNGGFIKNLNIIDADISVDNGYVGILVGFANHTDTTKLTVQNCNISGTLNLTHDSYAGGIVGYCNGTIDRCSSNAIISSGSQSGVSRNVYVYVGGIAGTCTTITNSYSSGTVSSSGGSLYYHNSYVGGIAGSCGTITNCYSTAEIVAATQSSSYAGGIAGCATTITNCFAVGNVSTRTYSFSGTYGGSNIGRIIGEYEEGDTVTSCYADSTQVCTRTSSTTTKQGTTNDYGTLQFTHTLQSESFIYETLDWSSEVWEIVEGQFPRLK